MRHLVAETDLNDAFLLQPWPYPALEPEELPPFSGEDLSEATGETFAFAETLPAALPAGPARELHYQDPQPYGILIRVLIGRVYCVALDMREGSTTHEKWEGHVLSAKWGQILWLPPGFAHSAEALSGTAKIVCSLTEPYIPGQTHALPMP